LPDKTPYNPDSPEDSKKEKVPEIRYVPIEYMPHMNEGDDDEIDLVELAKNIWDGRWTIAKITGVFVAIGLFVALFSPVEYESEAILMPEVQQADDGRAGQLLQRFGGAFGLGGMDLSNASPGTIPPMIYPRIVKSLSFQIELMEQPVLFAEYGVTTTIPDFYENHYSPSLTQWIGKLTIGLPYTVLGWFRVEEDEVQVVADDASAEEFIRVSKKRMELIEEMRERISVNLDEETGLLNTRVRLHDARAAAELNRHLIELLKNYITDYRLEKARQDLEFVETQFETAKTRFEDEQIRLADFRDQNITLSTARAQTELERLQDQKDIAFNVYNSLAQQLEQSRLRLQEQTPVFSTVQPVNVPDDKSSPRRGRIVIFALAAGIIIGTTTLLVINIIRK
jgi:uncharacterized protein involved in exopolysaccharide biosynthesis